MGVDTSIELYDSDLLVIEAVLMMLNEKVGTRRNIQAFHDEIIGRFAEGVDGVGFRVSVTWHEYAVGGQKVDGAMPEIMILGRIEEETEFDRERQQAQVVGNILELPGQTKGETLKMDNEQVKQFMEQHKQTHGSGCGPDEE
jgi:hypothetical protein